MKRFSVVVGMMFLGLSLLSAEEQKLDLSKLPPVASDKIDFQADIRPLLEKSCLKCHGVEKQKGGLRLDSGIDALKGSNSGPVIKSGDSSRSRLIHVVAGLDAEMKMPPSGKMFTPAEVGKLRAWIDQGANFPKDTASALTNKTRSTHWSFQPVQRPAIPKVGAAAWVRNDIDALVLARLAKEKLTPAPEADRVTLARRLSLDLLGLPPTLPELDEFLNDTRPDAYERYVDRLLASPHYGERWGRHWLDLARYADSDGFEKDTGRPFAWRYRNWVIDAFNRDLPFDQFTIEQLAGDLLPPPRTPPSQGGDGGVSQKVATGFHRNTLTNKEGGVDKEQFRVEAVVDRVNTTAKVFLGVTLGCSQCHDHKYDPFSQREYYQLFAFFNSDEETDITAPLPHEIEPYNKKKAAHDKKAAELKAAQDAHQKAQPALQQKWESELKLAELRKLPAGLTTILLLEPDKRTPAQNKELAEHFTKNDTRLAELAKAVTDHQKAAPVLTKAQTLSLGSGRKTHIMIRGDFLRKGIEVSPETLSVLPPLKSAGVPTRLDLARWIVAPANPLTPRVAMNWAWHKFFGRGIVATLEDFGTQGERPAHPELLDWLASEFVQQKWSLKAMHKLIVTSATYRQSSRSRPELMTRDPLNVLLARQSRARLEAEIIRDICLASSGLLTRTVGGPSVRPPQPSGISELTYAGSARWVESSGADRYRRGMYTWFQRTSPYPMLLTFDAPDSNVCCVRRERSNTPLQALTLLNDTVFFECAQALGKRVVEEKSVAVRDRIRQAFRLCVAREPAEKELVLLGKLFDDFVQNCKSNPDAAAKLLGTTKSTAKPTTVDLPEAAAWIALARTLMNLDEFVTRE